MKTARNWTRHFRPDARSARPLEATSGLGSRTSGLGPRTSGLGSRTSGLGPRTSGLGEVVIVMGLPGAGKSTVAERLTAQGFTRLNRDESGGTLRGLLPALDRALTSGTTRIVLDNTYGSRASRAEVIRPAAPHGFPPRCVWVSTSVEDAQTNAASRLVSRYGRLPDEGEIKRLRKTDPAAFLPGVQFRYQRELEPPDPAEG